MFNLQVAQGLVLRDPKIWMAGGLKTAKIMIGTVRAVSPKSKNRWDFIDVRVSGKLADLAQRCIRRGLEIFVVGRAETEEFTNEDGAHKIIQYLNASALQIQWPGQKIDITGDIETAAELATQVPEGYVCITDPSVTDGSRREVSLYGEDIVLPEVQEEGE